MKKILSVFIVVLILISCFSFSASASKDLYIEKNGAVILNRNAIITFSDDYKILYVDDVAHSRFNCNKFDMHGYNDVDNQILYTATQEEEIREISLNVSNDGVMFETYIYFNDGSNLSANFLRDDYIEEYNRLEEIDAENLHIVINDGSMPNRDEIIIETTQTLLKGEKVDRDLSYFNDFFEVSVKSEDFNLFVEKGCLVDDNDEYYYVDYSEIGVKSDEFEVYLYEGPAYKISDLALIQQIEESLDKYYQEEDYGIFFNDNFTETVSKIFIALLFAIIPFIIFVLTLIFGIRSKKVYRKLHLTACILSALELISLALILLIT